MKELVTGGVTVDKREASIKKLKSAENDDIIAVDLPGAYSMSPFYWRKL